MAGWTNNVQIGSVGGTPIIADLSRGAMGGDPVAKRVRLTADYSAECPPGFPKRLGLGENIAFPHIIASGTTFETTAPEAAALIAAGAAVLV